MASSAILLLATAVAGVLGLWLLEVTIRRSDAGLALVLGTVVLSEILPATAVTIAGINIGLADVTYALILCAAIARLLRVDRMSAPQLILVAILILLAVSLFRGMANYGIQTAFNGVREPLRLFGATLYFSTVTLRAELTERLGAVWLTACAALAALAVVRWAGNAAGLTGDLFGPGGDLRVIPSSQALILAMGFIITVLAQQRPGAPRWLRGASGGLLLVVVLLQHRTTWVILLLTLVVMVVRSRELAPRLVAALTVGGLAGAVLLFTVFGGDRPIQDELSASARNADTFEWRIAGWSALLEQAGPETPIEVAIGLPYGSGWDRRVDGRVIRVSPHNFYLETLLRLGVVGLTLVLALHVVPAVRLFGSTRGGRDLERQILFTLLVGLFVYYLTYAAPPAVSAVIGLAAASAADLQREPVSSRGLARSRTVGAGGRV